MKKVCIVVMTLLMLLLPFGMDVRAAADVIPSGIPYEELGEQISAFIEERKEGTASVSLAVFEHDNTLYETQYGYADIENEVVAGVDTVYEWGSVSKLFVWVSVMQLYEQGEIDLNEDIRTYLPEKFLTKLTFNEPITMMHLMNHNGGWQETTYDIEFQDVDQLTDLAQSLKRSEPPQVYEPGTVTAYSNWGTALAAYAVEYITGMDYAAYVKENILEPLGMEYTAVKGDWSDNQWVQTQRDKTCSYSIFTDLFESFGNTKSYLGLYPVGSAAGTIGDMLLFAKAFVPEDGMDSPLFENRETLNFMCSASLYYTGTEIARNCHGLWTMEYAVPVMGHMGNTTGFTASLIFDPESGLGTVVMVNEVGDTAFSYGVLPLLFGHVEAGEDTTNIDISGLFLNKRTLVKGFSSANRFTLFMPILHEKDSSNYSVAGGTVIRPLSKTLYLVDDGNGQEYIMNVVTGSGGKVYLESFTSDLEKNTGLVIVAWLLLLLLVISGIWALVLLIIAIIGGLRHGISKESARRLVALTAAVAGTIAMFLFIVPITSNNVIYSSPVSAAICCIIICILAVIPVVCSVWHIIERKRRTDGQAGRRYFVTYTVCMILLLNVIFFQVYNVRL